MMVRFSAFKNVMPIDPSLYYINRLSFMVSRQNGLRTIPWFRCVGTNMQEEGFSGDIAYTYSDYLTAQFDLELLLQSHLDGNIAEYLLRKEESTFCSSCAEEFLLMSTMDNLELLGDILSMASLDGSCLVITFSEE